MRRLAVCWLRIYFISFEASLTFHWSNSPLKLGHSVEQCSLFWHAWSLLVTLDGLNTYLRNEKGIDTTQTSNMGWMACCLGRCIFLDLPGYARSVNITWKKLTVQTAFRQDELKKERALVIAVPTEAPDSPGDKDCNELLQNCFSFFAKHLYICCSSSTFFFFNNL